MQPVDLYQPIAATRTGVQPLVIRVAVRPKPVMTEGGPLEEPMKVVEYVQVKALPFELQERVRTAVQALLMGQ